MLAVVVIIANMVNLTGIINARTAGEVWRTVGWVAAGCWALASTAFSYYRTLDDSPPHTKIEVRYGGTELLQAAIYFALATGVLGVMQMYETSPMFQPGEDYVWFAMGIAAMGTSLWAGLCAARGLASIFGASGDVLRVDFAAKDKPVPEKLEIEQ